MPLVTVSAAPSTLRMVADPSRPWFGLRGMDQQRFFCCACELRKIEAAVERHWRVPEYEFCGALHEFLRGPDSQRGVVSGDGMVDSVQVLEDDRGVVEVAQVLPLQHD
ncbi:hypothetical protein [Nocardia carnea]|uniref:hypothetical protein n=1 Tax=Nocardia carnea TaxID=37328 RepID=UPI002458FCD5|nr:hypothetical protein [Nocardia carnea]